MSKRIREICFESRVWLTGEESVRFGKAIIEECIQIIHEQERIPKESLYPKPAFMMELAIREHFDL